MADSPAKAIGMPIGVSGLNTYGDGRIYEEWDPRLAGPRGRQAYREMMDNDPIIGAILFSIEMLMRQVDWSVQPAGEETPDTDLAAFVDSCLHDMSATWEDQLSEVLSFLGFGWSLHEVVYKRRTGAASKHTDGKVGWDGWPIRGQETLDHWEFDPQTWEPTGMVQLGPPDWRVHTIPLDKALLFRTTTRKNNPEGRSLLRNAHRPWHFKKNIEQIEGIGIERDLAGIPIARVPSEVLLEQGPMFQAIQKIVTQVKRDENEGIVWPGDRDEKGNYIYEIGLMTAGGSRSFDTDKIITRYNQQITMVVMADFIMVGHERVGSNAMVKSKSKLFTTALLAFLDSICATINDVAIPRLLKLNGYPTDRMPKLAHGDIERADLDSLGTFIFNMHQAGAGMDLSPGSTLYNFLMKQGGLPEVDPEDAEEATQAAALQAARMRGSPLPGDPNVPDPPPPPAPVPPPTGRGKADGGPGADDEGSPADVARGGGMGSDDPTVPPQWSLALQQAVLAIAAHMRAAASRRLHAQPTGTPVPAATVDALRADWSGIARQHGPDVAAALAGYLAGGGIPSPDTDDLAASYADAAARTDPASPEALLQRGEQIATGIPRLAEIAAIRAHADDDGHGLRRTPQEGACGRCVDLAGEYAAPVPDDAWYNHPGCHCLFETLPGGAMTAIEPLTFSGGGGGHWVTIAENGEETHIFIGGGGLITKGPSHLLGAHIGHLPAFEGRTLIRHRDGHEPAGARDHPSYAEHTPSAKGEGAPHAGGRRSGQARLSPEQSRAGLATAQAESKAARSAPESVAGLQARHDAVDAALRTVSHKTNPDRWRDLANERESLAKQIRDHPEMKALGLQQKAEFDAMAGTPGHRAIAAKGIPTGGSYDPSLGTIDHAHLEHFTKGLDAASPEDRVLLQSRLASRIASPEVWKMQDGRHLNRMTQAAILNRAHGIEPTPHRPMVSSGPSGAEYEPVDARIAPFHGEGPLDHALRDDGLSLTMPEDLARVSGVVSRRIDALPADSPELASLRDHAEAIRQVQQRDVARTHELLTKAGGNLATLTGSPKQVAWAGDIRTEHLGAMAAHAAALGRIRTHVDSLSDERLDAASHALGNRGGWDRAKIAKEHDTAMRTLDRLAHRRTDAKAWIDDRGYRPIDHMDRTIRQDAAAKTKAWQDGLDARGKQILDELGPAKPLTSGSSRQQEWAGTIRGEHMQKLASHVANLEGQGHLDAPLARGVLKGMHQAAGVAGDASWWIDRRGRTTQQHIDMARPKQAKERGMYTDLLRDTYSEPAIGDVHADAPIGTIDEAAPAAGRPKSPMLTRLLQRLKARLSKGYITADEYEEDMRHALGHAGGVGKAAAGKAASEDDGGDGTGDDSGDDDTDDGDTLCAQCQAGHEDQCSCPGCAANAGGECACERIRQSVRMAEHPTDPLRSSGGEGFRLFVPARFAEAPEWIPYLPRPGTFKHPRYGEIAISADRNKDFVSKFNSGVYQHQIPLDAEHETKLSGAMGWIRQLRTNEDGSADARVDWTDRGRSMLAQDRFKFISPEWYDRWEDPATGRTIANVAIGGALTTRPYFKASSLRPLVASEIGRFYLPDEMTDNLDTTMEGDAMQFAEMEAEVRKFREEADAAKALSEQNAADARRANERVAALEQAGRRQQFAEEAAGFIGAGTDEHVAFMETLNDEQRAFYTRSQRAIAEQARVSNLFGEIGVTGGPANDSAEAQLAGKARAFQEKDPSLTTAKAMEKAMLADPGLYARYNREQAGR